MCRDLTRVQHSGREGDRNSSHCIRDITRLTEVFTMYFSRSQMTTAKVKVEGATGVAQLTFKWTTTCSPIHDNDGSIKAEMCQVRACCSVTDRCVSDGDALLRWLTMPKDSPKGQQDASQWYKSEASIFANRLVGTTWRSGRDSLKTCDVRRQRAHKDSGQANLCWQR